MSIQSPEVRNPRHKITDLCIAIAEIDGVLDCSLNDCRRDYTQPDLTIRLDGLTILGNPRRLAARR